MKNFLYLLLLLLGGFVASCSSGDDATDDKQTPVTPDKGGSWTVNMKAGMTRGLEIQNKGTNTETLVPTWKTDELIAVYYNNQKVGYLKPSTNSTDVSTEMALTGNLDNPSTPYVVGGDLYFYYMHDKGFTPDYTTQDGTLESIVRNYHYATATAEIKAVDNTTHTLIINTATFSNSSNPAIIRLDFDADNKSNSQLTQVSNLTISSPALTSPITITPTSAASEIYVAIPATGSSATFTFCETVSNTSKCYDKLTVTLVNGKYYRANIYLHEGVQLETNGPIWATMNVGATSVSGTGCFGDYFAWGGTDGHSATDTSRPFDWSRAPYYTGNGTNHSFSKYNSTDVDSELELMDDAVRQNWHGSWRMPTIADLAKLNSTGYSSIWETEGYQGRWIEGPNGNKIFLPAAGFRADNYKATTASDVQASNEAGYYWSSVNAVSSNNEYQSGQSLGVFNASGLTVTRWDRRGGFSVRGILP